MLTGAILFRMKRKQEHVRLKNLELLIAEAGSAAELARRVGTNSSYLSQVRNQMPTQKAHPEVWATIWPKSWNAAWANRRLDGRYPHQYQRREIGVLWGCRAWIR